MAKRKGYYTQEGYKGLVGNEYMLFDTEKEYEAYNDFRKNQKYYRDVHGIFGTPGAMVSEVDMINYWNAEYASDPVLSGYTSFNDWFRETIKFMQ